MIKHLFIFSIVSLITVTDLFGQYPLDSVSTFNIQLSAENCLISLNEMSVYQEEMDERRGIRRITANGIPSHKTGKFPNAGNPNRIRGRLVNYEVTLNPKVAEKKTDGKGKVFGILFSGVELDPYTAEFFQTPHGNNFEWNITTLTSLVNLGLDCNNGHVQPSGKYHYHGTPNAYLQELKVDGTQMVKVGYAADGFPIYYKYGYNEAGDIIALEGGYRLKKGSRPGDGINAPSGRYDGLYFQDYEYNASNSKLDECNGRWGKTPDSDHEYYYVITDNFPSSPLCFSGTPSKQFSPERPQGIGRDMGQRPKPEEVFNRMDRNHDGKLAQDEVHGPLEKDFYRVDQNKDGYITLQELKSAGPPERR